MNPYEKSSQFVTVHGIRFHYALEGDTALPTLALINMAGHNLTAWELVMDTLVTRFRVLRFDIRGTGKSGWGADSDFTFSQYADDLAGIMDALDISEAFVVGIAYGSRTAATFALRHSDKLNGLGLFDVSLTPPVEQGGQRELGQEAIELLKKAGEPIVAHQKYWRFYENRQAAFKAHTAHEAQEDVTDLLANVVAPTLIACGEQDLNLAESRRVAKIIPNGRFELMPMTGHGSALYRPILFAALLCDAFG